MTEQKLCRLHHCTSGGFSSHMHPVVNGLWDFEVVVAIDPKDYKTPGRTMAVSLEEIEAIIQRSTVKRLDLARKKGSDYSGAHKEKNHLYNIFKVEEEGICDVETGLLVRLCDKWARIVSIALSNDQQVDDETFDDSVLDFQNYSDYLRLIRLKKKHWAEMDAMADEIEKNQDAELAAEYKNTRDEFFRTGDEFFRTSVITYGPVEELKDYDEG